MKKIFIILFTFYVSLTHAQWSNTSNNFEDSLNMPVCTAPLEQQNPVTISSYPDGGYFVIWQDGRNEALNKTDIYAQKYDKDGKRLWAANGVPVANGPNREHYTFSSLSDYRNRKFAATDSAGGFYICYANDSVSSYVWERVTAQHIRSNGSAVFPDGYIVTRSTAANLQTAPQLIADGNKGFIIAYKNAGISEYIYAAGYKDENGKLKYYGGGRVNDNAITTVTEAPCGRKTDIVYPFTTVYDFNIWSDRDGGCNIIMSMNGNNATQGKMLCYNRLWRAKKDASVQTLFRNTTGTACPKTTNYQKGNFYVLYSLGTAFQQVSCGTVSGIIYAYINYSVVSNGFKEIDIDGYDYNFPKGETVVVDGNITADLIAVTKRSYSNNVISDFSVQGYLYGSEIFDSIPYQRSSFNNPDLGYNPITPAPVKQVAFFRDTLLGFSNNIVDFSLAAGGKDFYVAGLMGAYGTRKVKMQRMTIKETTGNIWALSYNTRLASIIRKSGEIIGSELAGAGGTSITYDFPLVTVSKNGRALFYIREYYRGARVSPIEFGSQLLWGAMGRPVATGVFNNASYNADNPFAVLDSNGKSGLITWQDNRNTGGNTGVNIFMNNVDEVNTFNYSPPVRKIKPLSNFSAEAIANPAVLLGTSGSESPIEVYNSYNNVGTSPVVSITDLNNMGSVKVHVYQHTGLVRRYNNDTYLNRNYTIKSDSLPAAAKIEMKLYFTKEEFAALKAADATIATPEFLAVVRQPNSTATAPAVYNPVAGEELLGVTAWDSIDGGYSITVTTTALGNFFVKKIAANIICKGAGISFTSNIAGVFYQWQVNTGSGFADISTNTNYNGTNTATMQVINAPASFSGNRYRCLVNNVSLSNSFYLQVANTWTGAANNLWENTANWSCGSIPDAETDVIINSGTVTVNSEAVCHSLKVSPGASVTVTPGFSLTVIK